MECRGQDARDVLGLGDQEGVLGDGHGDAHDVGFLEGVGADEGAVTWPVMATMGTESMCASAMAVTRLVAPGPEVAMHTPTSPVTMA